MTEPARFRICLTLGRLLRAARYADTRIVARGDERYVHKRRLRRARLLVRANGLLVRLLDTGVRVLPQKAWEERERLLYRDLYGASVRIDQGGVLLLPCLTGDTLAWLLEDTGCGQATRQRAMSLAAASLAEFHARGLTHGDAMAENVIVDLAAGVARWFDFETVHESARPMDWRRADDVRALLATCVIRTAAAHRAETIDLLLNAYGDEEVTRLVAMNFAPAIRRQLVLHLGQAPLSWYQYTEIGRLLRARIDRMPRQGPLANGARDLQHIVANPVEQLP